MKIMSIWKNSEAQKFKCSLIKGLYNPKDFKGFLEFKGLQMLLQVWGTLKGFRIPWASEFSSTVRNSTGSRIQDFLGSKIFENSKVLNWLQNSKDSTIPRTSKDFRTPRTLERSVIARTSTGSRLWRHLKCSIIVRTAKCSRILRVLESCGLSILWMRVFLAFKGFFFFFRNLRTSGGSSFVDFNG